MPYRQTRMDRAKKTSQAHNLKRKNLQILEL
jgi:hypothetical protein